MSASATHLRDWIEANGRHLDQARAASEKLGQTGREAPLVMRGIASTAITVAATARLGFTAIRHHLATGGIQCSLGARRPHCSTSLGLGLNVGRAPRLQPRPAAVTSRAVCCEELGTINLNVHDSRRDAGSQILEGNVPLNIRDR
jgi:hypothetical protein